MTKASNNNPHRKAKYVLAFDITKKNKKRKLEKHIKKQPNDKIAKKVVVGL